MAEDISGFLEVVASEAKCIERFVRLLEREKDLLTEGRTEALAAAVEEKEALAAKLNELTRQRGRYLVDEGFTPDREGMDAWSVRHPEQGKALALWRRTQSLAEQAKELNRLNGQLVQLHMQYTSQALEILSRRDGGLDLYGPDGRSTTLEGPQIDDAA
ncbi:MAG: flagellar protein FlgN [Candidatus Accumulibacter sp.]|jgi:flagella synthesis protein FlgN|nr:flagellar protein FlgN [Accumulibacter sp.]